MSFDDSSHDEVDYIQINKQLLILFGFRSFRLIILIFLSSYIIGIFWFIICNFNRVYNAYGDTYATEIGEEIEDGFDGFDMLE